MADPYIPRTIEEAVTFLYAQLDEPGAKFIKDNEPASVHHFTGMHLRNHWGLWHGETPLKRDAITKYRIAHPDDITGLVLAWLFAREKGEGFDPDEYVQGFHIHWKKYGQTALAAGGYNEDGTPKPSLSTESIRINE